LNTQAKSQKRSFASVGTINAIAAIVGLLQAVIIGRTFGVSPLIETYFAAVVFYQSILKLLQTGQIIEIATPIFHQLKANHGKGAADQFFSGLLNSMLLLAVAASVLLFFTSPLALSMLVPGFSAERRAICLLMFRWIIPCLALQMVGSILTNWLAVEKQFVLPAVLKVSIQIVNLLPIIALSQQLDAWVLVLCLWILNGLTVLGLGILLLRSGCQYSLILQDKNRHVIKVFKKIPDILFYVSTTQWFLLTLNAGMTILPQGSLAIFTYAQRISSKIDGLLLRPVSLVFFNHFSEARSNGSSEVRSLTQTALGCSNFAAISIVVIVLCAGFPGMCTLWLSNKYPEQAVFSTYIITCLLATVPIASVAGLIYRKINMTHQKIRLQYFTLAIIQVFSALYAIFIMPSLGFTGVAIALVANPISIAIANGIILRVTFREYFQFFEFSKFLRYLICGIAATLPVLVMQFFFYIPTIDSNPINFLVTISSGSFGILIFIALSHWLKLEEAQQAVDFGFSRFSFQKEKASL